MVRASRVKPLSYFKANAAKVIRELNEVSEPMIITRRGEAKLVLQDIVSYERTEQTMALLKILALGERQIKEGKTVPLAKAMRRVRERLERNRAARHRHVTSRR
jgi:prevent-host-death family protein